MEGGREALKAKGPAGMCTAYQGTAERTGCWDRVGEVKAVR